MYYDKEARDFEALSETISSIYDLRGIGVSAVYVSAALMEWILRQGIGLSVSRQEQCFEHANVNIKVKTKKRFETVALEIAEPLRFKVTVKPYGADKAIPVKTKYTGDKPWKIVATYRDE